MSKNNEINNDNPTCIIAKKGNIGLQCYSPVSTFRGGANPSLLTTSCKPHIPNQEKGPSLQEEVYSPPCLFNKTEDKTTEFSHILTVLKLTLHITRTV
jgi:hypothetical protein